MVRACLEHGVAVIPFGGGTSVSGAANCPENERRTIACLDTTQMNRILWIDRDNLLACCEAGIIGQDLERELRLRGLTSGHEPDSYEFSRFVYFDVHFRCSVCLSSPFIFLTEPDDNNKQLYAVSFRAENQ